MNLIDYLVLLLILILVILAVRYCHRHPGCNGNCSNCPYCKNGSCEVKSTKKKRP